jgi:hypothetical protein
MQVNISSMAGITASFSIFVHRAASALSAFFFDFISRAYSFAKLCRIVFVYIS